MYIHIYMYIYIYIYICMYIYMCVCVYSVSMSLTHVNIFMCTSGICVDYVFNIFLHTHMYMGVCHVLQEYIYITTTLTLYNMYHLHSSV